MNLNVMAAVVFVLIQKLVPQNSNHLLNYLNSAVDLTVLDRLHQREPCTELSDILM